MPNSMVVTYPHAGDRVQVQGHAGNFFIPYMNGTACFPVGAAPPMTVKTCDTAGVCTGPVPATCNSSVQLGGEIVCCWSASQVPIQNASPTGVLIDAIPNLNGVNFAATRFTAFGGIGGIGGIGVFAAKHAFAAWRPHLHVRFLTATVNDFVRLLADAGMEVSKPVKLNRVSFHRWMSSDYRWSLHLSASSAEISADIDFIPGVTVTQTWISVDFDLVDGGDFHPQPLTGGTDPLIKVALRVK